MDVVEELEQYIDKKRESFAELVSKYNVVSAEHDPAVGSYVILADRTSAEGVFSSELGYASPSPFTGWLREERVPELMGKIGLRTYYDMKRADGTVRGALRLIKTPILAARWFVEPETDSAVDKNIAKFVEENLFDELSVPWTRVVEDSLLMCEYGFMPFELVWSDTISPGKLKLSKIAPRHPMDIMEWLWDRNGGVNGLIMEPSNYGPDSGFQGAPLDIFANQPLYIPIEKMVIFTLEQEAGDLRGISILRSAYKHYYYKDTLYKIDAIQKERHGIGIPVIKLPPGFTTEDKRLADELGRNLRTNERAHIVVPSNWEIIFAEIKGQPVDCMISIQHHDMKIKSNILAPFMDESNVKPDSLDVYFKSTRYIANTICDTFNHFVIPKIVAANFARGNAPKLRVRRIGEWEDMRTMSFAVRNFVGAGIIEPDDPLEKFIRSELDLPPADPKTSRVVSTPQLEVGRGPQEALKAGVQQGGNFGNVQPPSPAPVGPPRQTAVNVDTPKGNAGRDASGGKKK